MNIITKIKAVTMSSREIAELVDSRHDKVKKSIERLATSGVIQLPPMGNYEIINGLGITTYGKEYLVGKRDSYIVVAQLSPEMTARLVDRWQALEALQLHPAIALPNYQEALRELANQLDVNASQQALIEQQKPAVAFVDRFNESSGSKTFREVCKILEAKENEFRQFLFDEKIMYRLNGALTAYQCHVVLGRFKVTPGLSDYDHAYVSCAFTPKGIAWVAGLWMAEKLKNESVA